MTRLSRVLMALSAVVLMAQLSWAAEGVRVTAERVNLRSKPSTASQVVAKVSKGTILTVLGHESGWVRVAAPGSGAPAYISARLCEPTTVSDPAEEAASRPAMEPARSETTFTSSGARSSAEPRQFGAHVNFATKDIGLGFGVRASGGIPVVPHLGLLGTIDLFLGAQAIENGGVEVEADGKSIGFGLYPTYGYEFGDLHAYAGAGLSILRTSYTISVATPDLPGAELSGSEWDTSLGLVTGVKFQERFFGEVRYQFGGGSHLTFSAGVVFGSPW